MKTRHFLSLADFTKDELLSLIHRGRQMKKGVAGEKVPPKVLEGKYIGLIFEKPSTRTRVSFEVGIRQLGGQCIFLSRRDIQLGRGEPVKDTARILSRYVDGLVIRTFGHHIIEEFAEWSSIPVVNALTDLLHPCQVLGDLMTLQERGLDITKMNAAWIGDGNNMANSWINAAKVLGFRLSLACPEGYDPGIDFNARNVELTRDPAQAATGADVISTDVWASMGWEDEADQRREIFRNYQVNGALLQKAAQNVFVLHCLPAHRGEEITDEVLESSCALVWDQAENRLHIQKAILELLFR
jgi:ornithine carbamoyltransferase|uniref:Ornithine carbamoyltransferase n=1 Tax=Desulfomonile tiedjei TaxID=2358 RepID=A0A7C4EWK2_9BACT